MTPAPMTDEQIVHNGAQQEHLIDAYRAIIAARDAQWAEMLKGQEQERLKMLSHIKANPEVLTSSKLEQEVIVWRTAYETEQGFCEAAMRHNERLVKLHKERTALLRQALEALETNLEVMEIDWHQIDSEWGPSEGGIEAAIDGRLTGYGYFQKTIDAITAIKEALK